ncbi:hypothetical protein OPT61_g5912 [Boeremia exigua]|uniref:Uncharacterized protein n=1 Tax=Boeremia exigua TaxID=749465 RepID=A0ACC2I8K8_9PLEO|nr:hypothetical protein OPT61_g5912 [Boeremia exigua]
MVSLTSQPASGTSTSLISLPSPAVEPSLRRRRVGRIDALNHLAGLFIPWASSEPKHLHEVICYSIWLSLIVYYVAEATPKYFENIPQYPHVAHHVKLCLTDIEAKLAEELNDKIFRPQTKIRIMEVIETMDKQQSREFLENSKAAGFYEATLSNQTALVEDFNTLSYFGHLEDNSAHLHTRCLIIRQEKDWFRQRDLKATYSRHANLNEERLLVLLDVIRALREAIGAAANSKELGKSLLKMLMRKLKMFDINSLYSKSCSIVGWKSPQEPYLVRIDSEEWWKVTPIDEHVAGTSRNEALAYPAGQNMRSTLTFVVPTFSLLSIIPAAMAWKHGEEATGNTYD